MPDGRDSGFVEPPVRPAAYTGSRHVKRTAPIPLGPKLPRQSPGKRDCRPASPASCLIASAVMPQSETLAAKSAAIGGARECGSGVPLRWEQLFGRRGGSMAMRRDRGLAVEHGARPMLGSPP